MKLLFQYVIEIFLKNKLRTVIINLKQILKSIVIRNLLMVYF